MEADISESVRTWSEVVKIVRVRHVHAILLARDKGVLHLYIFLFEGGFLIELVGCDLLEYQVWLLCGVDVSDEGADVLDEATKEHQSVRLRGTSERDQR